MTIVLFIVVLLVLIVGHEAGHFVVAKLLKMKVLEFGVGFPPKIWGKKIGETEYTLNWLPFGGFVRIFGEDDANPKGSTFVPKVEPLGNEAMYKRSKVSQAAVIAAGPIMNVVIGFLLFAFSFMIGVPAIQEEGVLIRDAHTVVGEVLPGSPAEAAGIRVGDRILSAETPATFAEMVSASEGAITVSILRGSEILSITATPQAGIIKDEPSRKALGIASVLVGTKQYSFFEAISAAAIATWENLGSIVVSLAGLIAGAFTLSADLSGIAGPVGIASLTGSAAAFGLGSLLMFAAMLSLNLAIVNLLPFPALDGGRLLFMAVEAVTRRSIPHAFAARANTVGFALLILLMLVVTWHDIGRLVG